jgi:hypothetical protein
MSKSSPKSFAVSQDAPNPFSPSTTLKYELPHASHVMLKPYNALGEQAATLVNEVKQPGTYTVEFNGSSSATGVYFCRLRAGDFVQTKKFVLLR